jgi:hypothetical protein
VADGQINEAALSVLVAPFGLDRAALAGLRVLQGHLGRTLGTDHLGHGMPGHLAGLEAQHP